MTFEKFIEIFRNSGSYYKILDSFIRVEKGLEWYKAAVDAYFDIHPEVLNFPATDLSNCFIAFLHQDSNFRIEGADLYGDGIK